MIKACPGATARTRPVASTVATLGLRAVKVAWFERVTSTVLPSGKVPIRRMATSPSGGRRLIAPGSASTVRGGNRGSTWMIRGADWTGPSAAVPIAVNVYGPAGTFVGTVRTNSEGFAVASAMGRGSSPTTPTICTDGSADTTIVTGCPSFTTTRAAGEVI